MYLIFCIYTILTIRKMVQKIIYFYIYLNEFMYIYIIGNTIYPEFQGMLRLPQSKEREAIDSVRNLA
jgi:hypothetical protein